MSYLGFKSEREHDQGTGESPSDRELKILPHGDVWTNVWFWQHPDAEPNVFTIIVSLILAETNVCTVMSD